MEMMPAAECCRGEAVVLMSSMMVEEVFCHVGRGGGIKKDRRALHCTVLYCTYMWDKAVIAPERFSTS